MHPYKALADAFSGTGAQREAYDIGLDNGHGLACHNKPEAGIRYDLDGEAIGPLDDDAPLEDWHEAHIALCHCAESHARCYSPWEFIAAKFNAAGEFERHALWEAYEQGVYDAIAQDILSYGLEDYTQ